VLSERSEHSATLLKEEEINMVRLIMHGCNGTMGRVITNIVKEDEHAQIVAGIDCYQDVPNDYPVFKTLEDCNIEADVVIDFSVTTAVDGLLNYCAEHSLPVVLCTTGLSEEQLKKVEQASSKTAVLKAANMSLGVNMLLKLLQNAAKVLVPAGFDIEVVDRHHKLKVDAPSGTAIAMADSMNQALNHEYTYNFDRSKELKMREQKEIGVVAVRGGTIVGEHDVIFAGTDEVVEFKHTAYSKAIFAKGAIEASKFLAGKPAGRYDMSDVIEF